MNNYIKGRQQPGQGNRPPMKPEELAKMKEDSMALLVVEFHNNPGQKRFWSKCGQRKHRNINEAINYLMWLVQGYKKWQGTIHTAAIFDARLSKSGSLSNRIYKFENNIWSLDPNVIQ